VHGDLLLGRDLLKIREPDPTVEPGPELASALRAALHVQALLLTTIWLLRTLTTKLSRGRGGGPSTFLPLRS